jgi:hypothetical protein
VKRCETVADSFNAKRFSLTPCFSKVEHSLTPYLQLLQQFAERLRRTRCHIMLMVLPRARNTLKSQILNRQLLRHDLATDHLAFHIFAPIFLPRISDFFRTSNFFIRPSLGYP